MFARATWQPMRRLCRLLMQRMDELAPLITAHIRAEEPTYRVVAPAEHVSHVHEQQIRLLEALAEQRPPAAEDLRRAALLGRRRAAQGLSVQAVIGAYHVGNRELWNRLRAEPNAPVALLPEVAALMWQSVQLITSALAEAHAEVTRAMQADQVTLRHRFVTLLQSGVIDEEAVQVAGTLGFDVEGDFVAVCSPPAESDGDGLSALRSAIDVLPGMAIAARSRESVVVIAQVGEPPGLLRTLGRVRPGAALAVGLERRTLAGAAQSLCDAQRVLATMGTSLGTRGFGDHWLQAVLVAESAELRALVQPRLDAVRANPHLAQAVVAFAEHDLSATSAARAMGLHPNTTMYRLTRWHQLTGWDPRTFSGLARSLLASWIASAGDEQDSD